MKFIHNSFSFHYFFSVTSMWIIHGMAVYSARSAAPILQERKSKRKQERSENLFTVSIVRTTCKCPHSFLWTNVLCRVLLLLSLLSAFFDNFFYHHHNTYIQKLHVPFHSIPFEHLSYSFIHSSNVVLQQNLL